jgi:glycine/D-amino acid oxidase-like deaminating enzyme
MNYATDAPSPLWAHLSRERFESLPLDGRREVDIVVIGGGIGGLSAALHLRQAGKSVVLLEASTIGAGASGRNNGQVIPTLTRHDPKDILQVMGSEAGERFLQMLERSADLLFETIERYSIDCDAVRNGWMQPSHSPGRVRVAAKRVEQWQMRGAPAALLDRAELARRLGTDVYFGGWFHAGGGHINPLSFTRGLARAAREEGVSIYERSPAVAIETGVDGFHVHTPLGHVRCQRVAVITAAHTGGLWPDLARTIVPVQSYQLATEPLPEKVRTRILPGDEACSDTRNDLLYFRKDREGRLVTGGALALQFFARPRLKSLVGHKLAATFPWAGQMKMPFYWGGRIAMTTDRLPRLHRRADGLVSWIGCNGRGLALAMGMGAVIRDAVLDKPKDELALIPSAISPLPFHGLVRRTARLALLHYRRRDAKEVR